MGYRVCPKKKEAESKEIKIEMCAENKAMIQEFISRVTGKTRLMGSVPQQYQCRKYVSGSEGCTDGKGNCLYQDVVITPEIVDNWEDTDLGTQLTDLKNEGKIKLEVVSNIGNNREIYIYTAGEAQLVVPVVYEE